MKKFVRGNAVEDSQVLCNGIGRERNGSAVGVLHTAPLGSVGEVIDEGVDGKRIVVHPRGFRGHDALNRGSDLVENALDVGGLNGVIEVQNNPVLTAVEGNVPLLEIAYFNGRIDQAVIVFGRVSTSLLGQR